MDQIQRPTICRPEHYAAPDAGYGRPLPAMSVSTIARRLALESADLVTRERGNADERQVKVDLTAAAGRCSRNATVWVKRSSNARR
ncbi:hypothetical protein FJV76_16265 [Mesorhizobium sp. WSM4303]|uniref:hypothetical protein n=1 Tax=unclassified Mesorhizobium TaxID=325217 RepID=UPI00115EF63B|nr:MULTISPECIES: hypothetical protein [unclassified Mesorhizobium]TRC84570.1 hypothetical protein FJV77_31860 [Mesorhizobium sp. WSM4306]TRD03611.1 hypothetical protein FJV76_16265 [Mesorhizobium sp. WSM4303]